MKRPPVAPLIALVVLLSACVYDAAHSDLTCATDDDCGDGLVCSAGLCVEGDAGPDAPDTSQPDQGPDEPDTGDPVAVARIELTPELVHVPVGRTAQLSATAFGENDEVLVDAPLQWSSGSDAVATVDASGLVTGVTPGMVQIRVAAGEASAAALVNVVDAIESVEIAPLDPTVEQGRALRLAARALGPDGMIVEGRTFTWSSADESIAVADATSGNITGIAPGTVEISATADGVSGTTTLEVTANAVDAVEILPAEGEAEVGTLVVYEAFIRDAQGEVLDPRGRTYEWTLSDGSKGALSDLPGTPGAIRFDAQQIGPTVLTVVVDGGPSASQPITVIEKPVMSVTILPLNETVPVGSTRQLATEVLDFNSMPILDRAHIWESSDTGVISVDSMGVVTAHQPGAATITVTVDDETATLPVAAAFLLQTVDAGAEHACGVSPDGVAFCWGKNDQGQLGHGTSGGSSATPVFVAGDHRFSEIHAADDFTCALDLQGVAHCWGLGGALGTADGSGSDAPVAIQNHTFATLASYYRHSCAIATNGEVWCWGEGDNGELGDGMSDDADAPVMADLSPMGTPTDVAVGRGHSCVTTDADETFCWGNGFSGALGTGDTMNRPRPRAVTTPPPFVQLTLGVSASCGRTAAFDVSCWGTNSGGLLGVGNQSLDDSHTPMPLPNVKMKDISLGDSHGCGVNMADDVVHCWGDGADFKLGNALEETQYAPVPSASGFTASDVSSGATFTCAVALDGRPHCWGDNADGRAGTSSDQILEQPALVWPDP